jgi:hypothetical protein
MGRRRGSGISPGAAMMKRVLVADGDIVVTSAAQRCLAAIPDVTPVYTTDLNEALRQLSDGILGRDGVDGPRLYGAVIESLWPDAEGPIQEVLSAAGLKSEDVQDYRDIVQKGGELYSSSPPLGLLLAMKVARLKAPVVLTVYPTTNLNAQEQIEPIRAYAEKCGWKCYAPEKADKTKPDFWAKCITRFDNKWLERGLGQPVASTS